ncbi:MAG: hypothetical protein WD696_16110 [Bryobacteraceae bacterium]
MKNSTASLPKTLNIGSILVIVGGLVPLLASTVLYFAYLSSEQNPGKPWLSGQFPPGPAEYSLNDIQNFSRPVAVAFVTAQHIELVNVMNSGLCVVLLALYGLRRFQKWAWYAILFTALWPGLNDAWALLAAHEPPVPLIGEIVSLAGLFLARPAIFGGGQQLQPAATARIAL